MDIDRRTIRGRWLAMTPGQRISAVVGGILLAPFIALVFCGFLLKEAAEDFLTLIK